MQQCSLQGRVFWREKNNIGGAAGLGHGRKQGAYANTPLANVNPIATANATTAPHHSRRRRNDIMNITDDPRKELID